MSADNGQWTMDNGQWTMDKADILQPVDQWTISKSPFSCFGANVRISGL
ncbi:MAG: hypothetical protein FWF88_12980 [Peptococcaceae bacterium]|nr:hypothetical protein [Peptococcaceae bacterium]